MTTTGKTAVNGKPLTKGRIASMALAVLLSFMLALYGVPTYALANTADAQDATVKTQSVDGEASASEAKEASSEESSLAESEKESASVPSASAEKEEVADSASESVTAPADEKSSDEAINSKAAASTAAENASDATAKTSGAAEAAETDKATAAAATTEAIEAIEIAEATEAIEASKTTETAEFAETAEPTEAVEATEISETTETPETAEATEANETVAADEVVETTEAAESTEVTEATDRKATSKATAPARRTSLKAAAVEDESGSTSDAFKDKTYTTVFYYTTNNPAAGKICVDSSLYDSVGYGVSSDDTSGKTVSPSGETLGTTANPGYRFAYWFNMTTGTKYTNYKDAQKYSIKPKKGDGSYFVAVFVPTTTYGITYTVEGNGTVSNYWDFGEDSATGSTAIPDDGYVFEGWYQGSSLVSKNLTIKPAKPSSDTTYTAKFRALKQYNVTYTAAPAGFGSVSRGGETVTEGETAQGSTAADATNGSILRYFTGWYDASGNIVSYNQTFVPTEAQLQACTSYTAVFSASAKRIALSVNNPDYGYIGGSGNWIADRYLPNAANNYVNADFNGDRLRYGLIAYPRSGYCFSHWVLNGHIVSTASFLDNQFTSEYVVEGTNTLIAYFVPTGSSKLVHYQATPGGTISAHSEVIGDSMAGSTAQAADGYTFKGWYQDESLVSTEATYVPAATAADGAVFTAKFAPIPVFEVTYVSNDTAAGTVSVGSEKVYEGETASGSTASAKANCVFLGWYDASGNCVSSESTFNPGQVSADVTYTAKFRSLETYTVTYVAEPSDGGTLSRSSETVLEGHAANGSKATAGEDNAFLGWYDEEGTLVSPEVEFTPSAVDADAAYTAKFKVAARYHISYKMGSNLTNCSISSAGETVIEGHVPAGSTATVSNKSNRRFVAWTDSEGNVVSTSEKFIPSGSLISDGAEYYAVFARVSGEEPKYVVASVNNPAYGSFSNRDDENANVSGRPSIFIKDDGTLSGGVVATASDSAKYTLDHWEMNGEPIPSTYITKQTVGGKPQWTLKAEAGKLATKAGMNELVAYFKPIDESVTTLTYSATSNGSITVYNDVVSDAATGCTAVPDAGYKFTGWYLTSNVDGVTSSEKLSLLNTLTADDVNALNEDQIDKIKGGATIKAMFAPVDKGLVGYNMNLPGVDVKWSGASDIVMSTSKGAMMYYDATTYNSTQDDLKTFTVTNAVPQADGYIFVGWFDKARKSLGVDTPATLREAGKELQFCYSGATGDRYTLEALWLTLEPKSAEFDYDGEPHSIEAEATFIGGEIAESDKYADQLKGLDVKVNNLRYIYDVEETVDGVRTKETVDGVVETLPGPGKGGVYDIAIIADVEVNGKDYVGFTTNATLTIKPKTVTVIKKWEDNKDDGNRPESITLQLSSNEGPLDVTGSMEPNENGDWKYEFNNLLVAPGQTGQDWFKYTVEEVGVEGYQASVTAEHSKYHDEITITNVPTVVSKTVTKEWNDGEDQDGIRPDSVEVALYANGEAFGDPVTISAGDDGKWTHTFENLPEYLGGKRVEYTVAETNVPEGYAADVNGMVITNTHNLETSDPTDPDPDPTDPDPTDPADPDPTDPEDSDPTDPTPADPDPDPDPEDPTSPVTPTTPEDSALVDPESTIPENPAPTDSEPSDPTPAGPTTPVDPTTPDDPAPADSTSTPTTPETPATSETPVSTEPEPTSSAPSDPTQSDDVATDDATSSNTQRTRTQQVTTQNTRTASASTTASAAAPASTTVPVVTLAPAGTSDATPAPAAVVEAVADDAAPLAAPEDEVIDDDANPLAGMDLDCWVHWWILLGIIITAAYTVAVTVRRQKNSHDMQKMDDNTMDPDDERRTADDPAPGFMGGPVVA